MKKKKLRKKNMQSFYYYNNHVGSLYPICTQHGLTCYYGNMEKDVRQALCRSISSNHIAFSLFVFF